MAALGLPRPSVFGTPMGEEAFQALRDYAAGLPQQKPQAEMRAYEPSWRDRMAAMLMDNGVTRNVTQGLMGSTGLGISYPTGMGLVDMTPLGAPLWLNEAERAKQEQSGGLGSGMLDTLAAVPIPGAAAGARALKGAANKADDVVQGIRAYHGSPHDFDKFDMSKIGTGEGAQAYGHGLYFAEAEAVAQDYKRKLTSRKAYRVDGQPISEDYNAHWQEALEIAAERGDEGLREYSANLDRAIKEFQDRGRSAPIEMLDLADAADNLLGKKVDIAPGRMYEVNINAPPDEFLDWDKPLSEQPEKVKEALTSLGIDTKLHGQWTVEPSKTGDKWVLRNVWGEASGTYKSRDAAEAVAKQRTDKHHEGGAGLAYTQLGGNHIYNSLDKGDASEKLRAAGIKGIRYLDQGSRGPSVIYDVGAPRPDFGPYSPYKTRDDAEKQLELLRSHGFTDAEIKETPQHQSYNYVVFDDQIIDILKKYGIAGLAALGGAGALAGSNGEAQASP